MSDDCTIPIADVNRLETEIARRTAERDQLKDIVNQYRENWPKLEAERDGLIQRMHFLEQQNSELRAIRDQYRLERDQCIKDFAKSSLERTP